MCRCLNQGTFCLHPISYSYTLRNAEYRLSLERNLEIHVGNNYNSKNEDSKLEAEGTHLKDKGMSGNFREESLSTYEETGELTCDIPDFGEMTPEARRYILKLHSRLSSVKKVCSYNFAMCGPWSLINQLHMLILASYPCCSILDT